MLVVVSKLKPPVDICFEMWCEMNLVLPEWPYLIYCSILAGTIERNVKARPTALQFTACQTLPRLGNELQRQSCKDSEHSLLTIGVLLMGFISCRGLLKEGWCQSGVGRICTAHRRKEGRTEQTAPPSLQPLSLAYFHHHLMIWSYPHRSWHSTVRCPQELLS